MASIPVPARRSRLAPLWATVIALALLFLAAFAQIEALHNGAHDARHSAGMPCH